MNLGFSKHLIDFHNQFDCAWGDSCKNHSWPPSLDWQTCKFHYFLYVATVVLCCSFPILILIICSLMSLVVLFMAGQAIIYRCLILPLSSASGTQQGSLEYTCTKPMLSPNPRVNGIYLFVQHYNGLHIV